VSWQKIPTQNIKMDGDQVKRESVDSLPVHDIVHEDHTHDAITRIIAIGLDSSDHSSHALQWGKN
jgi:hypothetical protein